MEKLVQDCYDTVRSGGYVALLMQDATELGGNITLLYHEAIQEFGFWERNSP